VGHQHKAFQRRSAQWYPEEQGSLRDCANGDGAYGKPMLLEEVFCDVHTELIPASQHANQFPPVAEDQNELFCAMKTVPRLA
jgi:hypothetical protein